jgi:hypothetical protein
MGVGDISFLRMGATEILMFLTSIYVLPGILNGSRLAFQLEKNALGNNV